MLLYTSACPLHLLLSQVCILLVWEHAPLRMCFPSDSTARDDTSQLLFKTFTVLTRTSSIILCFLFCFYTTARKPSLSSLLFLVYYLTSVLIISKLLVKNVCTGRHKKNFPSSPKAWMDHWCSKMVRKCWRRSCVPLDSVYTMTKIKIIYIYFWCVAPLTSIHKDDWIVRKNFNGNVCF